MTTSEASTSSLGAPRLRVRGLVRNYADKRGGEARGIFDLDLNLARGEIVGLLGPNGSGKSTALCALAGLTAIDAGSLAFEGRAVSPHDAAYRASLGVVFQKPSVDDILTARENLSLALQLRGEPKKTIGPRVEALLQAEGLAERGDAPLAEFSGGMRRRVDLLRALAHDPSLLLMDEPSAGLDERSFRKLWDSIARERDARGISVVVATHRADEAARCDRLIVLAKGRVIARGTPEELVGRFGADRVELELADAARVESVRSQLMSELALEAQPFGEPGNLVVVSEQGAQDLVRIVEGLGRGTFASVRVRRPGLADAFFELAGTELDTELEPETPATGRRGRTRGKAA